MIADAVGVVYIEACVRFRDAAIAKDPTTQVKFGYLCELLEVLYPRAVEAAKQRVNG